MAAGGVTEAADEQAGEAVLDGSEMESDYGGLQDYGITGLQDHETTGLQDYGTTGPRDYRTAGHRRFAVFSLPCPISHLPSSISHPLSVSSVKSVVNLLRVISDW